MRQIKEFGNLSTDWHPLATRGLGRFELRPKMLCGNGDLIQAMYSFFDRAWWIRLWVLQELALAENATINCGVHTVSWQELFAGFRLVLNITKAEFTSTIEDFSGLFRMVRIASPSMLLWLSFRVSKCKGLSLSSVLKYVFYLSGLQCMDPRDRIFGFFGLLTKSEQEEILIDCSKSCTEVFIHVAKDLLQEQGLDILSLCQRRRFSHKINLPSRVPDWTNDISIPLHRNRDVLFSALGPSGNRFFTVKNFT